MPRHGHMGNSANQLTIIIDDGELVEIVGEHQGTSLQERGVNFHLERGIPDQFNRRGRHHPGQIPVDSLSSTQLQDIYGVDSPGWYTIGIGDEDVVPIISCHHLQDIVYR